MADEKTQQFEETKWWIDRGPVKEREKPAAPVKGIIEKWAYELLKGYNQDLAMRNLVDINAKMLKELSVGQGEWRYFSLDVGVYPAEKLAKIKNGLPLPAGTRGIVIDAGYSVRVVIIAETIGEGFVDIIFTDNHSLYYLFIWSLFVEGVFM